MWPCIVSYILESNFWLRLNHVRWFILAHRVGHWMSWSGQCRAVSAVAITRKANNTVAIRPSEIDALVYTMMWIRSYSVGKQRLQPTLEEHHFTFTSEFFQLTYAIFLKHLLTTHDLLHEAMPSAHVHDTYTVLCMYF